MIVSLRCENFRCFKDTKTIELAPLTLIFGENNSGKSALIQALHLPAHTLQSDDKGTPLALFSVDYDYGSFSDVVFKHDENERITLTYRILIPGGKKYKIPSSAIIKLTYGFLPKRKEVYLHSFCIEDSKGERLRIIQNKYSNSISKIYLRGYRIDLSYLTRLYFRANFLFEPLYGPFETIDRLLRKYDKKTSRNLMVDIGKNMSITESFEASFNNISHLGPLRIHARRTLAYTGSSSGKKVGAKGEMTLQNYSALLKRAKKEDKKVIDLINSALYQLGFIKKIKKHPIGVRHFEFWTQHKKSLLDANLADTGFGASQVLPVLFTLYASPKGSTLLFEQPEIHLHPAAQAELGTLFAKACSPEKRIIIETHSENLILRIQTEMAKRNLKPEDVIVYYIQPRRDGHSVIKLPLNKKGEFLKKWPRGFFEEGYKESLKLTKARLS